MFQHKFNVQDLKASTLAVDENRRIVVADSANRCIHVISLDTGNHAAIEFEITLAYAMIDSILPIRPIPNYRHFLREGGRRGWDGGIRSYSPGPCTICILEDKTWPTL